MKDYFALLGVGPDATPEELRRAYRDRAQSAMWDRPLFTQLAEAWEVLKDPDRRAVYMRDWHEAFDSNVAAPAAGARAYDADSGGGSGSWPGTAASSATTGSGAGSATIAMPAGGGTATDAPGGNGTLGERTRAVTLPPCPICQTPGAPGEEFCVECGFLVGSQPGTESVERPLPFLADLRDGRQYPLRLGENVVGRERGDVVLPDGTVSRRHARLFVQADGEVYLEDLGSTNGTWRMGTLLPPGQRAALGDGTSIQFGTIKMRLSIPDAPLALPQPQQQPASGDAPSEDESHKPIAALEAPAPNHGAAGSDAAEPVAKFVGVNGQVYALTETTTTFGRRSTNHFVLTGDPYVSGAHAQVVYTNGAFHVVDLGSTNGTSVNGRRIGANAPEPIKTGDQITLGHTLLTFHSQVG